jgi:hypothetical protein
MNDLVLWAFSSCTSSCRTRCVQCCVHTGKGDPHRLGQLPPPTASHLHLIPIKKITVLTLYVFVL